MYLTGFADEAARDVDGQIRATKTLGWTNIESRAIDGVNIHDLPDDQFDIAAGKLTDAGVTINCFGSTIMNWGKKIDEPNDASVAETRRAIPRMQRLGTKLVRIMSFAVLPDRSPDDQMEEEFMTPQRAIEAITFQREITGGSSWRRWYEPNGSKGRTVWIEEAVSQLSSMATTNMPAAKDSLSEAIYNWNDPAMLPHMERLASFGALHSEIVGWINLTYHEVPFSLYVETGA